VHISEKQDVNFAKSFEKRVFFFNFEMTGGDSDC